MRAPMTMRILENQLPYPWPIGSTVTTSKWRGLPAILLSSILLQPTSCHFQKPIYLNLKLIRYAWFLNPFENLLSLFLGPEFVFFPNTLCFITIIVSVDIIHVEFGRSCSIRIISSADSSDNVNEFVFFIQCVICNNTDWCDINPLSLYFLLEHALFTAKCTLDSWLNAFLTINKLFIVVVKLYYLK